MYEHTMVTLYPDEYSVLVTCATRYAIGRMSYMPSLVVGIVKPRLKQLDDKTLKVLIRDIGEAPSLGMADIDEPLWKELLADAMLELERRGQRG